MISFICNICGEKNEKPDFDRVPGPLCDGCNSSTRFRLIVHTLCKRVFETEKPLYLLSSNPMSGIGLSDAHPYAQRLARFPNYLNTFYHQEPRFDVMKNDQEWQQLDYVISSDVFEHTPPPADKPFKTVFSMLKSGGKLLLSVPTAPHFVEHYPNLNKYKIVEIENQYFLINVRSDATSEVFDNLRFHGGPGNTLEMRLFSREKIESLLREAGFSSSEEIAPDAKEYGISPLKGLSTVWIAIK